MRLLDHRLFPLLLLVLAMAGMPAGAQTFTITLVNGNTFNTHYQPQEADWDAGQILFLTEVGNWIAVAKDDIADVTSDVEARGIGRYINTTTIELARSPNDLPEPVESEQDTATAALNALQQAVLEQQLQQPDYTQQQFVEPGQTAGGIPVGLVGIQ